MRILCCCIGGNTRSVTLATLLKYNYGGHDALACSLEKNRADTLTMLFTWAQMILVVDPKTLALAKEVVVAIPKPILDAALGPDRWGLSMHPDLIPVACAALERLGFSSKKSAGQIGARIQQRYRESSPGVWELNEQVP